MDRRGKVPLEIEKVIKRQEVTETDMERGRFWRYCRNALNKGKNYASIINKKALIDTEEEELKWQKIIVFFVRLQGG